MPWKLIAKVRVVTTDVSDRRGIPVCNCFHGNKQCMSGQLQGFHVTPQKSAPPPPRGRTEHAGQASVIGLLLITQKRPHPLCLRIICHCRHGNRLTQPRSESTWLHTNQPADGHVCGRSFCPFLALSPAHSRVPPLGSAALVWSCSMAHACPWNSVSCWRQRQTVSLTPSS